MKLKPLFELLVGKPGPQSFNPWRDYDPDTDLSRTAPAERLERLAAHLNCRPRYILFGEAAGYQGCKVSGIAFTSERLLMGGAIPRVACTSRLTIRERPWSEPSATTVWGTLGDLGISGQTILWNAYPWHPHKAGNRHSNRTPTTAERGAGMPVLQGFLRLFPGTRIFAVGRNAEAALGALGVPATALRHPSMGGAAKFREGLRRSIAG
jgi:hypothetical protein